MEKDETPEREKASKVRLNSCSVDIV